MNPNEILWKHIPSCTNPIILVMIHVIMFYQNHVIVEMEWVEANIVEAKMLKIIVKLLENFTNSLYGYGILEIHVAYVALLHQ